MGIDYDRVSITIGDVTIETQNINKVSFCFKGTEWYQGYQDEDIETRQIEAKDVFKVMDECRVTTNKLAHKVDSYRCEMYKEEELQKFRKQIKELETKNTKLKEALKVMKGL